MTVAIFVNVLYERERVGGAVSVTVTVTVLTVVAVKRYQSPSPTSEGDFMSADLDALRAGTMEPFAAFTAADQDAADEENIGADFSERPYLY